MTTKETLELAALIRARMRSMDFFTTGQIHELGCFCAAHCEKGFSLGYWLSYVRTDPKGGETIADRTDDSVGRDRSGDVGA